MNLSKEMAVRLHRMMWSDMLKELGNNPSVEMRIKFKEDWIKRNFPEALVMHNCFLCEYSFHQESRGCSNCPIKWPDEHCNGYKLSYEKAPISDILALPEKDKKCADLPDDCKQYVDHDEKAMADSYYQHIVEFSINVNKAFKQYGDELKAPIFHALAEASGLSADNESVKEHINKIREYAEDNGGEETCKDIFEELSAYSGVRKGDWDVHDHVKAIKEKAVEEYFEKTPGAKLATMDVDQAFKQYADEQKAPIFRALAEASGLSADNESVKAHISAIRAHAVRAVQEEAKEQMNDRLAKQHIEIKDCLAKESGLDHDRPVGDHIREIVRNSMEAGAAEERDRIQEKIYEVLLS